jgi:hypothetical protein
MHKSQISLNRENLKKKGEGGSNIQSTRCLSFKKIDVNAKREDKLTH